MKAIQILVATFVATAVAAPGRSSSPSDVVVLESIDSRPNDFPTCSGKECTRPCKGKDCPSLPPRPRPPPPPAPCPCPKGQYCPHCPPSPSPPPPCPKGKDCGCKPGTYACAVNPNTGCPGWKVCNTAAVYEYAGDCPPTAECRFYEPSKSPYCVPPGFVFPGQCAK